MSEQAGLPGGWPPLPHDAKAEVLALADQARRTVMMARGLLQGGRQVDLTGLDHGIGLLCAKALDLPPPQGRDARLDLLQLVAELDALAVAMQHDPA